MNTCVITLGGTIGGVALENDRREAYRHRNIVAEWIKKTFFNLNIRIISFCNKDSRLITDKDLKKLTTLINKTNFSKYIIVQGTDTAIVTGRYLQNHVSSSNKCMFITGAFYPVESPQSDGPKNLTETIMARIRAGVFLVFGGGQLNPIHTTKNFLVSDVTQSTNRFRLSGSAPGRPSKWYRQYGPLQGVRYATRSTYSS